MLSGINGFDNAFLANLNQTEARISRDDQQMSSGLRVSQASDDPTAVSSIVNYQAEISRVTQVQTNLNGAASKTQAADAALQSTSTLLDQLISLGAQGASGTATATSQGVIATQVQQIAQQLVGAANTTYNGKYLFAADNSSTAPYSYDPTSPKGVIQNSTALSSSILRDASGNSIVSAMTAQQVFDVQNPDGTSATGNVFQAVNDLTTALQANDTTGIATAVQAIKDAAAHINQVTASYGNTENWITSAQADAADRLVSLQSGLSNIQDADVAAVATQLTRDQMADQAALQAHASLSTKSLFSYLG